MFSILTYWILWSAYVLPIGCDVVLIDSVESSGSGVIVDIAVVSWPAVVVGKSPSVYEVDSTVVNMVVVVSLVDIVVISCTVDVGTVMVRLSVENVLDWLLTRISFMFYSIRPWSSQCGLILTNKPPLLALVSWLQVRSYLLTRLL